MGFKTIALDFDGPLHSYVSGWTGEMPLDPPVEGSVEFVERLIADGWTPFVLTTRANTEKGLLGTIAWLEHYGYPKMEVTNVKKPFVAMLDDRAVYFDVDNPNFEAARLKIEAIANRKSKTKGE